MSDGTSRRIDDLPDIGGARLFGPGTDGRLALATQTEKMIQGERDCVSLVLQDGRTLVCTPDHRILLADGRWVRADELALGRDRGVVGLGVPMDTPGTDEAGYTLRAGELTFAMETPEQRLRVLAFARLLGHLLGDGSIGGKDQGRMHVGQALDREAVLDDIECLTGKRPAGKRRDKLTWCIPLPN